jgi:hypothetical protein
MRRLGIIAALSMLLLAVSASVALAVSPGSYSPTADSFNSANAPGSAHVANNSDDPVCVVNADLSIDCGAYVLGGVGQTNADVALSADYTAIIDCNNPGNNPNNPIESHTADFTQTESDTVESGRNGQLRVPAQSVDPAEAPQVCPNDRWIPEIRDGTLQLLSFTYTLTFAGFDSPYITITASDP